MTLARRVKTLEHGIPARADGPAGFPPPTQAELDAVAAELTARRAAEDALKAAWLRQLADAGETEIVEVLRDIDAVMQVERARLDATPSDAPRQRVLAVERRLFEACGHGIAEAGRHAAIIALVVAWGRGVSRNEIFTLVRRAEIDQRSGVDLADALIAAARSYVKSSPG
jgi:hypothetical protein